MVNIYVIENNINNKLYVGRTSQTLNKRMKCHRANANSYLKNSNSKACYWGEWKNSGTKT